MIQKGDRFRIMQAAATDYVVVAVKPFPNAKKPICNNVLLQAADGSGKHWIADFALGEKR